MLRCEAFPGFSHCHWETKVGTSLEGTELRHHRAVTWLRSYEKERGNTAV